MEAFMVYKVSKLHTPSSKFIGFDNLIDEFMRTATVDNSYPRYNVIKSGEMNYRIEIALAGYTEESLDIEFTDRLLVISGSNESDETVDYIHKGLSNKKFRREFTLAEHVVVDEATFVNGLLTIELRVEVPEEKRAKKIPIQKPILLTEG
jgi:molecular chaperone IbpA